MSSLSRDAKFLKPSKSGEVVSADEAFSGAVAGVGTLFDDLNPDSPSKQLRLQAQYPDEADHFVVDTTLGPIRIEQILFIGEIYIRETLIPLNLTAEYRQAKTGEPISQVATFEPHSIHGKMFSFEMHHIAESGETHVILRKVATQ